MDQILLRHIFVYLGPFDYYCLTKEKIIVTTLIYFWLVGVVHDLFSKV